MGLTQRERNELFEGIANTGLDMAGLDFDYDHSKTEVRHRATGSSFFVVGGRRPGTYKLKWAVTGGPSSIDRGDISWMEVCGWAGAWSEEVRYVERDFWRELKQLPAAALVTVSRSEARNTPFTADERAEIAHRLRAIKQQARDSLELTTEQISGIELKLDDLVEASERVGPKDWLVMVYGYAFGMIASDLVPPHFVQGVLTTVITGLGHIFGLGGMPPSVPPTA